MSLEIADFMNFAGAPQGSQRSSGGRNKYKRSPVCLRRLQPPKPIVRSACHYSGYEIVCSIAIASSLEA